MRLYSDLSDIELTHLLRNGNAVAFDEIYFRYKSLLHIHTYKKLGDFDDASDIIQELFTNLWIKRSALPDQTNLKSYLFVSVRNRILDFISHKKVESKYINSFQIFINDKSSYVTDLFIREREFAKIIEKEINELPPKMREIFILSRTTGLSHKEIAEKLNISENTVKNQVKGALKKLKCKFGLFWFLVFVLFY
ncbi:RNA polymerase sigma-70 factor [Pedobacter sp. WC2423]|uniref:RNA polymerase sigma-70 factor n=1 Tax=Pedobacter sp. WC2423 TaxID=3234142 RepID=UPI003465B412